MSLSRHFAKFIVSLHAATIPDDVMEKARVCLLNGYGIGMGSYPTPYAGVARSAAMAMYGEVGQHGATMLGDGRKTTVVGAVLANCALFHGRGQEDTCGAAHLGAIMIPLLTAMVEAHGYPLSRMLPALVAGYETGGAMENAYAGYTTPAGLRASPVYGVLAAAAAASKMMDLSEDQTAAALANAASFSGGILQSFADGTDEWRYQVGVAAQTGWTATQLAAAGSVSAPHAFEGHAGFVKAFARTSCDVDDIAGKLGLEWSILRVTFKPYPVCAFNQTPVTAALKLRTLLDATDYQDITKITVTMNPYETGYAGMDSKGPFYSISGTLMSIPFCIANTLLYGVPDLKAMTVFDNQDVQSLVDKVDLLSSASVNKLCCEIKIDFAKRESLHHVQTMTTEDFAYGREEVRHLIRRVGSENAIPEAAYVGLEEFIDDPEHVGIEKVLQSFALLPTIPMAGEVVR